MSESKSIPFYALFLLLGSSCFLNASFTDVATEAGLIISPQIPIETERPQGLDPWVTGAPVCAADLDRDGWTDLIACQSPERLRVYMNNRDGTFREEGIERGFGEAMDISGIAAGDFTNSGKTDLFLVPRIGNRYFLYENDGSGFFTEVAVERGADSTVDAEPHKGQSIALVDFDRDGYLDIHVTEWGVAGTPESDNYSVLLRNRGHELPGHFINVTKSSGLTQPHFSATINGFSSAWADFDEDGNQDLVLINDYGYSQFWWNNGDGTFTEDRAGVKVGTDSNGMGVAVADFNRDGLLDFFVSSFDDRPDGVLVSANRLYENQGDRTFKNVAANWGVEDSSWGWGAVFIDPDNNGLLDLLISNGYPYGHWPDKAKPTNYIEDARSDQTRFYVNFGRSMSEGATLWGITDKIITRSVTVLDYDNDGDEDVFMGSLQQTGYPYQPFILYRNDGPPAQNHFLRMKFHGLFSNRDGYGTLVKVTAGGVTQTALYQPTNAYIGQREPYLHFGLGEATIIERLIVQWSNGAEQTFENIDVDQVIEVFEPESTTNLIPTFIESPTGGAYRKDSEIILTASATGTPPPQYTWYKNGEPIQGVIGPELKIRHLQPFDAGNYTVVATNAMGSTTSETATVSVEADISSKTVARWWLEALLDGIRKDTPDPPVHARNLYHLSSAMWDAFWAFETNGWAIATPAFIQENLNLNDYPDREAARREAISYAAYRMIHERFKNSPGVEQTYAGINWLMDKLGYDAAFLGNGGNTPAAVGNRIGYGILAATLHDGANEENGYADATHYEAINEPLVVGVPGTTMVDPNRWQPLSLAFSITQNGIVQPSGLQTIIGPNAQQTTPFALLKTSPTTIWIDPGPQPMLGGQGHQQLVDEVVELILYSSHLDPSDEVELDISPAAILNNPIGTNNGTGRALNPQTGLPYEPNVVLRADYGRILAEYWADGPDSETPPGHWNVIFNEVSDHPSTTHQYRGAGPSLPRLEWDVRGYFALNAALHDAALTAWTIKRKYDSSRPISLIRYMGGNGQSSDPDADHYHELGLPLIDDLIELTTLESVSIGGRHEQIVDQRDAVNDFVGRIVVRSWLGNPTSNSDVYGGVGWILAEKWIPYQKNTFVSPAFPGYVSGHSTFSRAAAEVMTRYTGSEFFPGGMGEFSFSKDQYLHFEKGPHADVMLQWATYYDAADQAGFSRLYGGIHISSDDLVGRRLGGQVGLDAFMKANAMVSR